LRLAFWAGLATCLLLSHSVRAAEAAATVTLLDGDASIIRGAARYALAEGVRLAAGDIVEVGQKGLALIEFPDGAGLSLGPRTRLLASALPGGRGGADFHVVAGTLKHAQAAKPADGYRYASALAVLTPVTGVMVAAVAPGQVDAFVEAGEAQVADDPRGAALRLKSGEFYSRRAGQKAAVAPRPTQAFVASLPRMFLDPLPSRIALYKTRDVAPKRLGEVTYAEVAYWLEGAPDLRKPFLARFRARAHDPAFRAALVATMAAHPEWDPILFPEKYKPKPDAEPARDAPVARTH
jgi:hypothetical protein